MGIFSTCEACKLACSLLGPLVIFDAITCAQQVFAHSVWVSMLSWYRSMFKSKLATLPGLQREYITQFPLALKRRFSVWILQLLIDWISFSFFFRISKENGCLKENTHSIPSPSFLSFFLSSVLQEQINNTQHFYLVLCRDVFIKSQQKRSLKVALSNWYVQYVRSWLRWSNTKINTRLRLYLTDIFQSLKLL